MLAVMAQARFARSVHSFICELLMLTMPDIVKGNAFIRNDTDFCKRIDDAIRDATNPTASEGDYLFQDLLFRARRMVREIEMIVELED